MFDLTRDKERNLGKWYTSANQNGELNGCNDYARVSFSIGMINSLVREVVQNSLDAKKKNAQGPVEVEFSSFFIHKKDFPDGVNFARMLEQCLISNDSDETCQETFQQAIRVFQKVEIPVLRISDYNTRGLEGADTCQKGSLWSGLIKEQGFSVQKNGTNSGGSYGIGKAVVYCCSDLKTAFFSSLDSNGIESHVGVGKLVSFMDGNSWTTGTVYYGNEKKNALLSLLNLESGYRRISTGTDIYVMGFSATEHLEKELIRAVLDNFMIALWQGNLIVRVGGKQIDRSTLGHYIDDLPVEKTLASLRYENKAYYKENAIMKNYYRLLSGQDPSVKVIELKAEEYGTAYGFQDGDCTLYLIAGEDMNRKVLMSRHIGMKLFEQNHISGSISFTGILLIHDNKMDWEFRKIEIPSHDAWEADVLKNPQEKRRAKEMYSDLKKYLKNKVIECFFISGENRVDAYGAGEFLPDVDNVTDLQMGKIVRKKGTETLEPKVKNIKKRIIDPFTAKNRTQDDEEQRSAAVEFVPDEDGDMDFGVEKNTKNSVDAGHSFRGKDDDSGKDSSKPFDSEADNILLHGKFKNISLEQRLLCLNKEEGLYRLRFNAPHKAEL